MDSGNTTLGLAMKHKQRVIGFGHMARCALFPKKPIPISSVHQALIARDFVCAQKLINNGADLSARDADGRNVREFLQEYVDYWTALENEDLRDPSVLFGRTHLSDFKNMLAKNFSESQTPLPPLHQAIMDRNFVSIYESLTSGVDLAICDAKGRTAIELLQEEIDHDTKLERDDPLDPRVILGSKEFLVLKKVLIDLEDSIRAPSPS